MTDNSSSGDVNIKVICRIRPLNSSEEKAGSKFVLKFPTDDSISCGVSWVYYVFSRQNLYALNFNSIIDFTYCIILIGDHSSPV